MKRFGWLGWFLAIAFLLVNAPSGLAVPLRAMNPLEGQLLHHSTGAFCVYHDGIKFELLLADIGDNLVDAIPSATPAQRGSLFTSTHSVSPEPAPEPFPGYSLRLPL